jgi:para-nitrobenzyl esterase
VLPDQPALMFATGRVAKVPVIAGWASEDGSVMSASLPPSPTVKDWQAFVRQTLPMAADAVFATFPTKTDADVGRAALRFFSDWSFAYDAYASMRAVAQNGGKAWLYEFTRANPRIWPAPQGVERGAFHASDMAYAIGHYEGEVTPPEVYDETDRVIGRAMTGAWVQFVKTGNPNGPGLAEWRNVAPGSTERMEFGEKLGMGPPTNAAALNAYDQLLAKLAAPPQ